MTSVTLLGCDGSEWNLMDPQSPARLQAGLGGLHLPSVRHRWSTTNRRSGSRWKGSVIESRAFTLNVFVGDAEPPFRRGDDWRALDGQFWRALSTDALSTLVVGRRRLRFRLGGDNDFDFFKDPSDLGKAVYPISCIAEQPEWFGDVQTALFWPSQVPTQDYYGGGTAPPFTVDVSSLTQRAYVSNPGDLPSYPKWTIIGPASTVEVGIPGRTIQIPYALVDGDVVIIDTRAQTITDPSGNNLWPKMGAAPVDFAPIPPGDRVEIVVGMGSPQAKSAISVELTTRYLRAWGDRRTVDVDTPDGTALYPGADVYPSPALYPAAS
jgi:hypothetical protein